MSLLLENFAKVLTTKEAVEKLEDQILQWAVQGKLVPQEPKGATAGTADREGDASWVCIR